MHDHLITLNARTESDMAIVCEILRSDTRLANSIIDALVMEHRNSIALI